MLTPGGYHDHHADRAARIQRHQGAAAHPPAADRGPGARHRGHGRGRPLLHRRAHPDLGRAGGAGQGRARAAGRPRAPLRDRRSAGPPTRAHARADGGGRPAHAPGMTGEQARARLRAARGTLVGAGAGTGLSAKAAEAGGADLIVVYNSGRFRMAGRGSLAGMMPYGDANAIVLELGREVLPVVAETPVLAGVCGTDPFRSMPRFLAEVRDAGFAGVQNFPTVGLIDGTFRAGLEETGMGYVLEVQMVREAARLGLLTAAYVFDPEQAVAMADAGADLLVA